ncbi:hypothetical protein LTR60_001529 [Cryomyces antarcticus]|nr:hypothetical protein LTR60_001529 [Cryomyces antarcticus]
MLSASLTSAIKSPRDVPTICQKFQVYLTGGVKSSSTFRDETIGDFALPQELFQCGEVSLPSFQGLDLAGSQTTSDGLYMNDFSLNDLEMGQFFIPDDFGKWAHPTKNKVA